MTPKVGEDWYVQVKGSKLILVRTIKQLDSNNVTLSDPRLPTAVHETFARNRIQFVSKHNG